jgi:hypothetical protein
MNSMIMLYWESQSSLISKTGYYMSYKNSLKKLGLFSFLGLFMLASCKKPTETLGESLQPIEDILNASQTDTTFITASTIKGDRSRIDLFANFFTGNYVDDVFGAVRCQAVFQLAPSNTANPPIISQYPPNDTLTIESVTLVLGLQRETYGNNVPMTFQLNELMSEIFLDSSYFPDVQIQKSTLNLIKPGFEVATPNSDNASFSSSDPRTYLEFPLKESFGYRLTKEANGNNSFDEFRKKIHGLVLSSSTIDGRTISFYAADTRIVIRYRYNLDYLNSEQAGFSYEFNYTSACESFTKIDHQHFGTPLAALSNVEELDGTENCYLQSPGVFHLKINLDNVKWINDLPNSTLNLVELVVPYDNESKFSPISKLLLSYLDENGRQPTIDTAYIGGLVNPNTGLYRFNITRHVQSILNGDVSSSEVYLSDYPYSGYFNSITTRRSMLHGPGFSSTDPNKNMRLIVTYSR